MPSDEPRRPVVPLAFAAIKLVVHLIFNLVNTRYGWFRDELYYTACGRHLAFGYVDHPPGTPLLARVSEILFGTSAFAVRIFPAIASAGLVLCAGLVARELGGRRSAQTVACVAALFAPAYLRSGLLFGTVVFDQLFWSVVCLLAVRLLRIGDGRLLPWIGALVGLGLEFKHTMIFLVAGLVIGFAATPARRWLAQRETALAVLLAALVFAPNLVWQLRNGWPTLEFLRAIHAGKMTGGSPLGFVWIQLAMLGPWIGLVWAIGLGHLVFAREAQDFAERSGVWGRSRPHRDNFRAIGIAYVAILGLFVVIGAKPYYLAAFYPVLLGAGAVRIELWTRRAALRWVRMAVPALITFLGIGLLPVALPIFPPAELAAWLRGTFGDLPFRSEGGKLEPLPQDYADMIGWERWVAAVAEVRAALPPAELGEATIMTSNYGEASAVDVIGPRYGLPRAVSGHNNYWLWGPGPGPVRVAIAVGFRRSTLEALFADVREAGRIHDPFARHEEDDLPIWVCRDPIVTLADAWPRLRHYN